MKKFLIASIVAVIAVIGMASPSEASGGCVTKREWRTLYGDATPNQVARHFGTRGSVMSIQVSYFEMDGTTYEFQTMKVRYKKCRQWGARRYVKITYIAYWDPAKHEYDHADLLDIMRIAPIR